MPTSATVSSMMRLLYIQLLLNVVLTTFSEAQQSQYGGYFNLTAYEGPQLQSVTAERLMNCVAWQDQHNLMDNTFGCPEPLVGSSMFDKGSADGGSNVSIISQSQILPNGILRETDVDTSASNLDSKSFVSTIALKDISGVVARSIAATTSAAASSTSVANGGAYSSSATVAGTRIIAQVQIPMDLHARVASGSAMLADVEFTKVMESALAEALDLPSGATVTITSIKLRRLFLGAPALENGGSGAHMNILGANDVIFCYQASLPSRVATSSVDAVKNAVSLGGAGSDNFEATLQSKSTQKLAASSLARSFAITGSPKCVGIASSSTVVPNKSAKTMSGHVYVIRAIVFLVSMASFFFGVSWVERAFVEDARLDGSVDVIKPRIM